MGICFHKSLFEGHAPVRCTRCGAVDFQPSCCDAAYEATVGWCVHARSPSPEPLARHTRCHTHKHTHAVSRVICPTVPRYLVNTAAPCRAAVSQGCRHWSRLPQLRSHEGSRHHRLLVCRLSTTVSLVCAKRVVGVVWQAKGSHRGTCRSVARSSRQTRRTWTCFR